MPLSFRKKFLVPLSEVTPCYAQKPFHFLNMLQDAADGAVEAMRPPESYWTNGCGWMLLQYTIRLDHPLRAMESGVINTGHDLQRDLYSIRRFILEDDAGKEFGMADSKWVYVDLAKRRPQRLSHKLPPEIIENAEKEGFKAIFQNPAKLERVDSQTKLRVRMGELDINGHVNNAWYLSWAAEAVPKEIYMTCGIKDVDIQFKHEALSGMELTIDTQQDGMTFRHEIKNGETLLAFCSVTWAKMPEVV